MVDIPNPLKPGKAGAKVGALCRICDLPHKLRSAIDQKLFAGGQVKSVWRWASKAFPKEMQGISYDVFYRHRRTHVKGIERAIRKMSDATRMQREKIDLAKAVLKGDVDPQAFFSPAELARDISKTERRLDSAAEDAATTRQHSALSSLSSALIRSYELRGKLGGNIQDKTEITVSVALSDVHARLDGLIGANSENRQSTARGLLGLPQPPDPIPTSRRPVKELDKLSKPGGEPLTIDAERVEAVPVSRTRNRVP